MPFGSGAGDLGVEFVLAGAQFIQAGAFGGDSGFDCLDIGAQLGHAGLQQFFGIHACPFVCNPG